MPSSSPPPQPVSHLQQLVLLTLPLSHVLVECNDHSLGLGAALGAHAQLGQLVTHGAMERGEVLGDGSLPPYFLSTRCRGARCLLNLCELETEVMHEKDYLEDKSSTMTKHLDPAGNRLL